MIPIISILGRPNVGKSSLFNKLVKQNIMLVSKFENLTNDRNYYISYINKYKYLLIDNKGLNLKILNLNFLKKNIFLEDCDIILFLTDFNLNYYEDNIILNYIRKKKKYIFFLINKIDNNKNLNLNKFICFYKFLKFFFISTSHNYNINKTIYKILKIFCLNNFCEKLKFFKNSINICLIGKKNTGKSSFLNSILNENRILIKYLEKTYDNILIKFKYKKIFFNFFDSFIDLKFINNLFSIKFFQNIIYSNIVLFFFNVKDLKNYDFLILNYLIKKNLNIVIILNKIDLLNLKSLIYFKKFIRNKIKFYNLFYKFFNSNLIKKNKIYKYFYKIFYKSLKNLNLNKFFFLKNYLKINFKINIKKIFQVSKNPYIINIHFSNNFNFKKKKINYKNIFLNIFKLKSIFFKINYLN